MAYRLGVFRGIELDEALLALLIDEHARERVPRLSRLWNYYRNALAEPTEAGGSAGKPAQVVGLPARLWWSDRRPDDRFEREIVIENDIAWRMHTLVDFMFPSSPRLVSTAADPARARRIESVLESVFEGSGGIGLWHEAALLGSVFGYVDLLLDVRDLFAAPGRRGSGEVESSARRLRVELIEPRRAIPLPDPGDYRTLRAYIVHFEQMTNDVVQQSVLTKLSRALGSRTFAGEAGRRGTTTVTRVHSASHVQHYEDERLVWEAPNPLGRLPVVHVQNLSQSLVYEGLSDVEPLIPLQDELNTRLSDRANRVTMQSFRMWLGKGIDEFMERPIGPGQMWFTDNPDASIEGFGGDADSPSERAHIEEVREAIDKASGVTPAAAGHIRARVGNLTSENALRISLMGTIAKIKRKRITYGVAIRSLCELILHALDVHGSFRTGASERGVELVWPDPLPADETRRIADAVTKAELGIPMSVLRAELGYEGNVETSKGRNVETGQVETGQSGRSV